MTEPLFCFRERGWRVDIEQHAVMIDFDQRGSTEKVYGAPVATQHEQRLYQPGPEKDGMSAPPLEDRRRSARALGNHTGQPIRQGGGNEGHVAKEDVEAVVPLAGGARRLAQGSGDPLNGGCDRYETEWRTAVGRPFASSFCDGGGAGEQEKLLDRGGGGAVKGVGDEWPSTEWLQELVATEAPADTARQNRGGQLQAASLA